MTRSFERLTETQLAEELASFEERMAGSTRGSRLKKLVQNLRVHQIELEMQNRELRDTQTALEEARDRFADLYDFAPVGYLTLNTRGEIQEINLTGTRMLGSPRAELLKKPLSSYLEGGQSKIFFRHLSRAFADDTKATVELALRSGDRETPWVLMESLRTGRDTHRCRTVLVDITERRDAERLRRESEDRLALIADNVPVLIAYVDANRRYVFNNAAYERWFDHSLNYIHGRHMREILGEGAYDAVRPYVDAALAGQEARFEVEIPYRDAGNRYISATYVPHTDRSGEIAGFFVVINDLSDRHRAEQALAEERTFVSAVLDTAGALVMVADREGRIVRFNRECERVTGYSTSEVQGRRFDMFLLPEERPAVEDVFDRLKSRDFPTTHEHYWVTRDGARRLIAWSSTVLDGADGQITHVVATGVDVTEQRRVEDELRHSARQLKLVTDAVPVLIAYVDRDMRYRFVNAAYQDWYGAEPDDMVGHGVDEFVDDEAFAMLRSSAERAFRGEEVFFENTMLHRRRGRRVVSATLVPDRNPEGGVDGYFSVGVDITERRQNEDSDKRRLLEAAHADRLSTMGEMTTEIAHELNQPLTAIVATADVCVDLAKRVPGRQDEMLVDALTEISGQARRAAQIIKHVRAFARRREPDFVPTALERIIEDAIALISIEARSGAVSVDTFVHGPATIDADPLLIEQLIVNLARNAAEAMTLAGTESPRVRLTTSESAGTVDITVSDNGPGLSSEAMEHLFEPFYTTKPDGMGLGLAICRSIIEAHGGRIWADSSAAGGAEFTCRLQKINDREAGSDAFD